MTYQPYPTSGQPPAGPTAQPPASITNAVRLMYAGAAFSAVSLLLAILTISSLKTAIRQQDTTLTNSQINAAVGIAVGIAIFFGLIGIGLWVWMAQMNRRGRSWARIVATVFFGIDTLFFLLGLIRPHASISLLTGLVTWLIGLGAIIFLYRPDASAYIQAMSNRGGFGPPPGQSYGPPPGYGAPQ
jgi:hypothetical protein